MRDGWQHTVRDSDTLVALYARLGDMPHPFHVQVKHGEGQRSLSQNALMHAWFGQIAKATHDDPGSVKADCHIRWGIPMLCAEDPAYADFIKAAIGGRPRAQCRAMIEAGFVPCSRIMPKAVLAQYMAAIWREYSPHVRLTDPEAMKHEQEGKR